MVSFTEEQAMALMHLLKRHNDTVSEQLRCISTFSMLAADELFISGKTKKSLS